MNLVIIQTSDMKFLIPVSRFEPFIFRDMGNTLERSANVLLEENACKGSYGSSEKWRSMWWSILDSFWLKSGKIISNEVLETIQTSLTTVHRSVIFKNLKKTKKTTATFHRKSKSNEQRNDFQTQEIQFDYCENKIRRIARVNVCQKR